MREIETQTIGRDQRALLRHVIAEDLPQRLVQQMRRRMILPDRAAAGMIDFQIERNAGLERALLDRAVCTNRSPARFCVSVTAKRTPSPVIAPVSPIWPPDSA